MNPIFSHEIRIMFVGKIIWNPHLGWSVGSTFQESLSRSSARLASEPPAWAASSLEAELAMENMGKSGVTINNRELDWLEMADTSTYQ